MVSDPSDRERRDRDEEGLSDLAKGYRGVERYAGAATTLVAAVGGFTAIGYWLDKKFENRVPWFLLAGAVIGMVGGFISFFRTVLGKKRRD
jgi:F0F1-type ATP synthase assembly protein I